MERLVFNKSPAPTIGVELEIQIIDGRTFGLVPLAPEILRKVPPSHKQRIKPEFIRSMVEINTGICGSVAEVEDDLKTSYSLLGDIARGLGAALYAVSLHPFSKGSDQVVSDHPRYKKIMQELQLVGRRFISQGLHVHIGVDDREKAIKVNNNLRIYLPVLLALTTSSPFYESEDTGLMSYRAKLFEDLPLAGIPDLLHGWEEYTTVVSLLEKSGIIESVKDIWWDVRPHPDFGTVEVRVCDMPYSLHDVLAVTALVQALVITLAEQHEAPEPHIQILRSNKWQAARYGLEGFFVDPFFGRRCPMKEAATDLYRHVMPVAERLGSAGYLQGIPEILRRATGAHIQKRLYYGKKRDGFNKMIRAVQELFFK